jgi:hypothetical protein
MSFLFAAQLLRSRLLAVSKLCAFGFLYYLNWMPFAGKTGAQPLGMQFAS